MKKKVMMLVSLLAVSMMSTSLISTAQAKIIEINPGIGFTEYYGNMGGANFYILTPDDWTNPLGNGMLIVLCRPNQYFEDPRDSLPHY